MDLNQVVMLFGGLAMFFYGMELMGNGLKKSSGETLKRLLRGMTKNTFYGMLTGLIVTGIIQSSSATIVLTVGLMAAGILNLRQSVTIVMGANIGTTVTAQIIRLMDVESGGNILLTLISPEFLAPVCMVIGLVLIMFIKRGLSVGIGEIFFGFGLLFIGLIIMKESVTPLAKSPVFLTMIAKFAEMPLLGILAGIVITVIVQSSSAVVGILQALSSTGVMNFVLIYPLIMGVNIGTCIVTAILCSIGTSRDAKRAATAHIIFNVIGTILFMLVLGTVRRFGGLSWLWPMTMNSGTIANFQSFFNIATAIVLMPFTDWLVRASLFIIKPDAEEETRASEISMLDEKLLVSPGVAMAAAERAVTYMGGLSLKNLELSLQQFHGYKPEVADKIASREDRIDSFADRADNFLIDLSRKVETSSGEAQVNMMMQATPDIERIGDYATNLNELAARLSSQSTCVFSEKALHELRIISEAVTEIVSLTVEALEKNDDSIARRIEPLEEVIDDMVLVLRDNHTERLRADVCTVQAGLIFLEVLTNLERTADQCSNIALHMLARSDREISVNHHIYLRKLHEDGGDEYRSEFERQSERYLKQIEIERLTDRSDNSCACPTAPEPAALPVQTVLPGQTELL